MTEVEEMQFAITPQGLERVQRRYSVKRYGEQRIVPLELMTAAEGETKARELEKIGFGALAHARELRDYFRERSQRPAASEESH